MRSVRLHCFNPDLICLDAQTEEELEGGKSVVVGLESTVTQALESKSIHAALCYLTQNSSWFWVVGQYPESVQQTVFMNLCRRVLPMHKCQTKTHITAAEFKSFTGEILLFSHLI